MPTASSSPSSSALCSAFLVASRIIKIRSLVSRYVSNQSCHKGEFSYLCSTDDLPPSSFTLGSSFNNSRQIENLNFCASILKYTRDGRQSRKRICRNFALCLRNFGKESGFANRRKADKRNACITALANIKPATTA